MNDIAKNPVWFLVCSIRLIDAAKINIIMIQENLFVCVQMNLLDIVGCEAYLQIIMLSVLSFVSDHVEKNDQNDKNDPDDPNDPNDLNNLNDWMTGSFADD